MKQRNSVNDWHSPDTKLESLWFKVSNLNMEQEVWTLFGSGFPNLSRFRKLQRERERGKVSSQFGQHSWEWGGIYMGLYEEGVWTLRQSDRWFGKSGDTWSAEMELYFSGGQWRNIVRAKGPWPPPPNNFFSLVNPSNIFSNQ